MPSKRTQVLEKIKSFGMTNQMLISDLTRVGESLDLNLGHVQEPSKVVEQSYYPQFASEIRNQAAKMARHYELFYCLERSVRVMVNDALIESTQRQDWWESDCVPSNIKGEVHNRIKAEKDSGVTLRSDDPLDYTTFGELGIIIIVNWNVFEGPLSSKKAVERVMASLNTLRNPIAHCCPLAEVEELRLTLALRDWFRLME